MSSNARLEIADPNQNNQSEIISKMNGSLQNVSTNNMFNETKYCGEDWNLFWLPYNNAHTTIATILCTIGCVTNICNIIVFTRKEMHSPTNRILLALSISDFFFVVSGFLFLPLDHWVGGWCASFTVAVIGLINEICFMLFHTWSCYITSMLGVWRFVGVTFPLKSKQLWTNKAATFVILIALAMGTPLVAIMYSTFHACEGTTINWFHPCTWICNTSAGAQTFDWIRAIMLKILPCTILILTTTGLVHSLMKANSNRVNLKDQHLKWKNTENVTKIELKNQNQNQRSRQSDSYRATSWMLVVLLLIFLISELPPGILALVTAILGQQFYEECQSHVFRLTCLLEYMSSTVNFFIYLIMIRKFRRLFFGGIIKLSPKWLTNASATTSV